MEPQFLKDRGKRSTEKLLMTVLSVCALTSCSTSDEDKDARRSAFAACFSLGSDLVALKTFAETNNFFPMSSGEVDFYKNRILSEEKENQSNEQKSSTVYYEFVGWKGSDGLVLSHLSGSTTTRLTRPTGAVYDISSNFKGCALQQHDTNQKAFFNDLVDMTTGHYNLIIINNSLQVSFENSKASSNLLVSRSKILEKGVFTTDSNGTIDKNNRVPEMFVIRVIGSIRLDIKMGFSNWGNERPAVFVSTLPKESLEDALDLTGTASFFSGEKELKVNAY